MCLLWEKQIFTKLHLIILCTASLEFSFFFFSVKPTANNAKTAACFNVPFHFLTSICHIFFHPLKLTETWFFLSCACASPCTQNSAVQLRLPDATKLQAVLITSHPAISFLNVEYVQISFSYASELQFCHR